MKIFISFGIISYYIYSNQIPNVNEIPDLSKLDSKYTNFVNELLNEDPEKRPTSQQIVSSFLTEREKTWLEDVDEDEVDRYLHKFGLSIKPRNQKIDIDFINSITTDKYPNNAKQPKKTIEEIINNESISKGIKESIKLAENYLTSSNNKNIKQIKKLLFNVGYQLCMGDKEVSLNIQEDYFYAIKYLKAAALLGDKTSFYLLSTIFSNEENQESQRIAFKLADISADLGCTHAFNTLAVYNKNGIGIVSNIIMAAIYFKIANIMLKISQKEISLIEFDNQLKIAKNIIQKIDGKSNKVYREIRYTLEAVENPSVALFVSEKYFEKAARNGNKEAEEIIKRIDLNAKVSQDHPYFYDEIWQTPSKSVCEETFDFDDQNW